MSVHMYVVDTVVIDTAQRHMRAEVIGMLKGHAAIERILLTHYHEDHSGNAAEIRRTFSAEVLGHPLTADKMNGSLNILPYQHLVWGKAGQVPVYPPSRLHRYRLLPLYAGSHPRSQQGPYGISGNPERLAVFRRSLLGDRIKYFRSDEKFSDQMDSLKTVLALDFNALFCGHHPIPKGGKARLAAKLAFLEDFYGQVTDLNRKGLMRIRNHCPARP